MLKILQFPSHSSQGKSQCLHNGLEIPSKLEVCAVVSQKHQAGSCLRALALAVPLPQVVSLESMAHSLLQTFARITYAGHVIYSWRANCSEYVTHLQLQNLHLVIQSPSSCFYFTKSHSIMQLYLPNTLLFISVSSTRT